MPMTLSESQCASAKFGTDELSQESCAIYYNLSSMLHWATRSLQGARIAQMERMAKQCNFGMGTNRLSSCATTQRGIEQGIG